MTYAATNEFQDYAKLTADGDAKWLDPGIEPTESTPFAASEVVPMIGTRRWVKIAYGGEARQSGYERWIVFVPGDAADNGWDDDPPSILGSAFVRCRVMATHGDGQLMSKDKWLYVAVDDVMTFDVPERRFPPVAKDELGTWRLSRGTLTRFQDWELWFAPFDDAGFWHLARLAENEAHVVAAGEWLYGAGLKYSEAWAGHVVVPISAWRQMCEPC